MGWGKRRNTGIGKWNTGCGRNGRNGFCCYVVAAVVVVVVVGGGVVVMIYNKIFTLLLSY